MTLALLFALLAAGPAQAQKPPSPPAVGWAASPQAPRTGAPAAPPALRRPTRQRGAPPAPTREQICAQRAAQPEAVRLAAEAAALLAEAAAQEARLITLRSAAEGRTRWLDANWIREWTCTYSSSEDQERDSTGCGRRRRAYRERMAREQAAEQSAWLEVRVADAALRSLRDAAEAKDAALRTLLGDCAPPAPASAP